MKRFIKIWVCETIRLFLILIGIVLILSIFFGVIIYWLNNFGIIGYLGIIPWSLFWLAGIMALVEYKKK